MLNRRNHREAAKGKTLSTNKMRRKEERERDTETTRGHGGVGGGGGEVFLVF